MTLLDLRSRHAELSCAADRAQARGDIDQAIACARQAVAIKKRIDVLTLPSAAATLAIMRQGRMMIPERA